MATKSKTLADFRAAHDPNVIVPNKIRAALEGLMRIGPEHWEYEGDFLKLAGLSTTQLSAYREQFTAHIVETPHTNNRAPRRVWFASPKAAKLARGE